MTKKRIAIRKFFYRCTLVMLFWGIFSTVISIKSRYEMNRERRLIWQAKIIQPFCDSEETLQSGLRSFFGNDGEWTVEGDMIHVSVERGFASAFPNTMEFDIPTSFGRFNNQTDDKLWIIKNVVVDGKEQTDQESYSFLSLMIKSVSDTKTGK